MCVSLTDMVQRCGLGLLLGQLSNSDSKKTSDGTIADTRFSPVRTFGSRQSIGAAAAAAGLPRITQTEGECLRFDGFARFFVEDSHLRDGEGGEMGTQQFFVW